MAPDAIHKHVKTVRGDSKTNHYVAPELLVPNNDSSEVLSPAVDIYSFGICALEMAALEISGNGETGNQITEEVINKTIESLDNPLQRDFIEKCIKSDSLQRPTARELLFHPIIFEVPSLRLLSAHVIVSTPSYQPEQLTEEAISKTKQNNIEAVLAEILAREVNGKIGHPGLIIKQSDFHKKEFDIEKYLEEVRNGAFPLTSFMTTIRPPLVTRQRTISPDVNTCISCSSAPESVKQSISPENPYGEEARRIISVDCDISMKPRQEGDTSDISLITLFLKMDEKLNRQLSCEIGLSDSPFILVDELVYYGFIHRVSCELFSPNTNAY